MKTVKTPAGTDLPLMNLKGKDYLMVAHRLIWFNETSERFHIDTDFLKIDDEQSVARAKVTVFDKEGKEIKHATATKRETKKDFPDHTEKAETGAIGRALALMGYGTQFAVADLDEGSRLADAPLASVPKATATVTVTADNKVDKIEIKQGEAISTFTKPAETATPVKVSTFRKPKLEVTQPKAGADGWE